MKKRLSAVWGTHEREIGTKGGISIIITRARESGEQTSNPFPCSRGLLFYFVYSARERARKLQLKILDWF